MQCLYHYIFGEYSTGDQAADDRYCGIGTVDPALTAGVMTIWIYRGTMVPLKKLQIATKNIKEGNLDFSIDYDEQDEMGDLCRNFEEMRKRLKESTEEKMAAEKENRA